MKFKLLIIIAFGMLLNVAANTYAEDLKYGDYLTSPEILLMHDGLEVHSFYFDEMEFMNLRVMDSEGNLISSERFRNASGRWSLPDHASDGSYKYEVEIKLVDKTESTDPDDKTTNGMDTHRQIGTFDVINGQVEPSEGLDPSGADFSQHGLLQDVAQIAMNTAGYVLELLVPSAQAADTYITDSSPALLYDDTADEGALTTTYDWSLYCDGGGANDDVNNFCRFYDKQFADIVMELKSEGNSANSMMVLENGDITFGNGALFLDRSSGFFAIGTTAVQDEEFTVRASNPEIALQDSTDDSEMNIQYDLGELAIEGNTEQDIVRIESTAPGNSMYIGTTGDIGIGTASPASTLNVAGGNDAQIRVDNTTEFPAAGDQVMFQLQSAAVNKVRFAIGKKGALWTFDNAGAAFQINLAGTGSNEFRVENDGDIVALKNSFAVNHFNTSSRNSKTDFAPIDEIAILEKLIELPMSTWRYKIETEDERHLGPIAEDFQLAFGLSDGKHISTVDASGVALTAIKGLNKVLQKRTAEIVELTQANSDLISANRALDERLTHLENVLFHQNEVAVR